MLDAEEWKFKMNSTKRLSQSIICNRVTFFDLVIKMHFPKGSKLDGPTIESNPGQVASHHTLNIRTSGMTRSIN
jgi:hypothetical protein